MFDSEYIQNVTLSAAAIVPIIVALVQMFKLTSWVNENFAPFLSVGFGILVAFLLAENFRADFSGTIFTGIIYGLSASGLYSGVKTSAHALNTKKLNRLYQKDKSGEKE